MFCFNIILIYNDTVWYFKCQVTLNLSSNVIGNSDDETNFLYMLFLTNIKVSILLKGFANGLSVNIKVFKTQLPKIIQLGGVIRDIGDVVRVISNILSKLAKGGRDIARKLTKSFIDKEIDNFNKDFIRGEGSGKILTSN